MQPMSLYQKLAMIYRQDYQLSLDLHLGNLRRLETIFYQYTSKYGVLFCFYLSLLRGSYTSSQATHLGSVCGSMAITYTKLRVMTCRITMKITSIILQFHNTDHEQMGVFFTNLGVSGIISNVGEQAGDVDRPLLGDSLCTSAVFNRRLVGFFALNLSISVLLTSMALFAIRLYFTSEFTYK